MNQQKDKATLPHPFHGMISPWPQSLALGFFAFLIPSPPSSLKLSHMLSCAASLFNRRPPRICIRRLLGRGQAFAARTLLRAGCLRWRDKMHSFGPDYEMGEEEHSSLLENVPPVSG